MSNSNDIRKIREIRVREKSSTTDFTPIHLSGKIDIRIRPNHPQWILRQTRLLSAWELFLEKPAVDCQTYDDGYQNSYTVGHKVPPVT